MIKIFILDYSEDLARYEDDEGLSIDIDCNDDIAASKYFNELSDINKIKIDAITQFNLKPTKKNLAIFNKYININSRCLITEPYRVQVLLDGYRMFEDSLYFNGYDKTISVTLS